MQDNFQDTLRRIGALPSTKPATKPVQPPRRVNPISEIVQGPERARRQTEANRREREAKARRQAPTARPNPRLTDTLNLDELPMVMARVDRQLGTRMGDANREAIKAYLYAARERYNDPRPLEQIAADAIGILQTQGAGALEAERAATREQRRPKPFDAQVQAKEDNDWQNWMRSVQEFAQGGMALQGDVVAVRLPSGEVLSVQDALRSGVPRRTLMQGEVFKMGLSDYERQQREIAADRGQTPRFDLSRTLGGITKSIDKIYSGIGETVSPGLSQAVAGGLVNDPNFDPSTVDITDRESQRRLRILQNEGVPMDQAVRRVAAERVGFEQASMLGSIAPSLITTGAAGGIGAMANPIVRLPRGSIVQRAAGALEDVAQAFVPRAGAGMVPQTARTALTVAELTDVGDIAASGLQLGSTLLANETDRSLTAEERYQRLIGIVSNPAILAAIGPSMFDVGASGVSAAIRGGKQAFNIAVTGMNKLLGGQPISRAEAGALRRVSTTLADTNIGGVARDPEAVRVMVDDLVARGVDPDTAADVAITAEAMERAVNQAGAAPTGTAAMPEGMARQMAEQGVPVRQEPEVSTIAPVSDTGNRAQGEIAGVKELWQMTLEQYYGLDKDPTDWRAVRAIESEMGPLRDRARDIAFTTDRLGIPKQKARLTKKESEELQSIDRKIDDLDRQRDALTGGTSRLFDRLNTEAFFKQSDAKLNRILDEATQIPPNREAVQEIYGRVERNAGASEATKNRARALIDEWENNSRGRAEAHYNAVKQALAEGKPVPPEVLADYPELTRTGEPNAPIQEETPPTTQSVLGREEPEPQEQVGLPQARQRARGEGPQAETQAQEVAPRTYESVRAEAENLRGAEKRAKLLEAMRLRAEAAARGERTDIASGLDPIFLKDLVDVAKTYIEDGVDWVRGLREDVGQEAEPYIESIQRQLDEEGNQVRQASQEAPQAGQRRPQGARRVDRTQEAGQGRVPAKGKSRPKEEVGGLDKFPEGFKQADVAVLRDELGIDPYKKSRKSDKTLIENVKSKQLVDRADAIADEYYESASRALNDEEQVAVGVRLLQARDEWRRINTLVREAGDDVPEALTKQYDEISRRVQRLAYAADRAGTEAGRALRARQLMIAMGVPADPSDWSAVLMSYAKKSGVPVSRVDENSKVVKALKAEVDKLKGIVDDLRKQRDEIDLEKAKAVVTAKVVNDQRVAKDVSEKVRSQRTTRINNLKSDIKAAWMKRSGNVAGAGLGSLGDLARLANEAPDIARMIKQLINERIVELNPTALTDEVFDAVRATLDELDLRDPDTNVRLDFTNRDIVSSWAGLYDAATARTVDDAKARLSDLKQQARIMEVIERMEKGEPVPARKGRTMSDEAKELMRRLVELRRLEREPMRQQMLQDKINFLRNQLNAGKIEKRGIKPINRTDLDYELKDLRDQMKLNERIADYEEQLRTGLFIRPSERVDRASGQTKALRERAKVLRDKINGKILAEQPMSAGRVFQAVVINAALANPIARVGDLVSGIAKAGSRAVELPIRVAANRLLARMADEGVPTGVERVFGGKQRRVLGSGDDTLAGRARQRIGATVRGETAESTKYGKGPIMSRLAGVSDAIFSQGYRDAFLDDLAFEQARKELGKGATKERMDARIKAILSDPPAEWVDMAEDFAKIQTYNMENVFGQLERVISTAPVNQGRRLDKLVGRENFYEDIGRAVGAVAATPVRFSKVIGNVVMEAMNYSPLGLTEATIRTGLMAKAGYSPVQARLISEQFAKGLVGTGLLLAGYFLNEAHDPEIVRTEGGTIFMKENYIEGFLTPQGRVFAVGRFMRLMQDMASTGAITQKQAEDATMRALVDVFVSNPAFGGAGRITRALDSTKGGSDFAADTAFAIVPGSSFIRQSAKMQDSVINALREDEEARKKAQEEGKPHTPITFQELVSKSFEESRVKTEGFEERFQRNLPWLRPKLPRAYEETLQGGKFVPSQGEKSRTSKKEDKPKANSGQPVEPSPGKVVEAR